MADVSMITKMLAKDGLGKKAIQNFVMHPKVSGAITGAAIGSVSGGVIGAISDEDSGAGFAKGFIAGGVGGAIGGTIAGHYIDKSLLGGPENKIITKIGNIDSSVQFDSRETMFDAMVAHAKENAKKVADRAANDQGGI